MPNRTVVFLLTLLINSSYSFGGNIEISKRTIPQKMFNLYKKYNCKPIDSKWWSEEEHPGGIEAPYAMGFIPGSEDKSVIFLCNKEGSNKNKKSQIIFHDEMKNSELSKCPIVIDEVSFGRGIRISPPNKSTVLKNFYNYSQKKPLLLDNVKKEYPSIIYEYDGVGNEIYCYKGKWWFRGFH